MLSRVAEELGRLYAEKAALRDQVRSLQAQVEGVVVPEAPSEQAVRILSSAQQTADNYVAEAEEFSRQITHDARVRVRGADAGGPGDRRRDPPGGAGGGGARSRGRPPRRGRRRRPHRRGAPGAGRLPQGVRPGRAASSCAPTSRRCSATSRPSGAGRPGRPPREAVRPPEPRSGRGRGSTTAFVANTAAENQPDDADSERPSRPCTGRSDRRADGRGGRDRPGAARIRGMVRCPPDHGLGRPRPPALARRPAAPHRPRATPTSSRSSPATVRLTYRRVRRRGEPAAAALADRGPGEGRPAGAAVAQLLAVRRARLRDRPARRRPGAGQLHAAAPTRSPSSSSTRGAVGVRRRGRARAGRREGAGRRRRGRSAARGWIRLPARRRRRAGRTSRRGWTDGRTPRRTCSVGDDDPVRLMYTSGTESRPKGVMLSQPLADGAVRQLHRRRRHERRRRRAALAAALPLRPAGLLPRPRRLPRRDQRHPARRPTRPRSCAAIEARAGHQALRAADGVDLAAALPRLRRAPTCRRLRKGYYGASPMPVEVLARDPARGCPTSRLWNFYGQTEMAPLATILAARRAAAARRLGRAARRSTSRPGSSTTTTTPVPRRHGRRDRAPQPARDAGLLRRRREDRRGVPRRLVPLRRPRGTSTRTATCTSWTARRT